MTVPNIDGTCRRALVFTPMETDVDLLVEAGVRAEALGYEAIVIPEGWGLASPIVLAAIGERTERIRLVSGVCSIWGRSAATLAMTAATMAEVTDGRYELGLGASTPTLAEQFHRRSYARPAAALEETITTVRALLAGDRHPGDGDRNPRLGVHTDHWVRIWAAALGPRASRVAVSGADTWFPAMIPRAQLSEARAAALAGTADGRTDCELAVGPLVVDAGDAELARTIAQQQAGWYLTAMGTVYADRATAAGHGDAVVALRAANPRPRPGGLVWPSEADPLLDELAIAGDARTIADGLRWWDAAADLVAVTLGPSDRDIVLRSLEAAAPDRS